MQLRPAFWLILLASIISTQIPVVAQSISPIGKDGKPLNLDFETGDLKDWKIDGKAFTGQPIKGDTIATRKGPGGMSNHHGNYWIGGYEIGGDDAKGTLTSVPFKVTQPFVAFLVGGGHWPETRAELVDTETQKAFFKISGEDSETMRPVVVDLKSRLGKEIFIRLVDEQTGGWGHINFDDFKFYAQRPSLANELDPKNQAAVPEADRVLYEGLSPEDAVAKMTLPAGFKATLFAGEPDVKQPIAFAFDDRGRLWVAEAYTYPKRAPEGEGKDRIIVFEDTDGDGKFNNRIVFAENLNLVSGIEIGFGGVFVGAAPYLMFIPVNDWDNPKPSGKPEILLDGWDFARDTHETLNSFTWGPDGWLYGCHGVFCPSNVGKPGTPAEERQWVDAAVWRYHPTKKTFEVFAEGSSNPWGVDFDQYGQCIIEACVIPHLFHMVQGGRFHRQGGLHYAINADERQRFADSREGEKPLHPYIYDDIKTVADHVHYAGNKGPHAGNGRSDSMGGGHAHAGLMVYQGDNFPQEYRNKIFMNNIHGQRINMDIPERKGSTFVGHHGADFVGFNDRWSQIINLQTGPDGAVYMIDWYDKNQCHHNDANGHDRSNGRIFRISYGETKFEKVDLQKLNDEELVKLLASKNDWQARHAQRILQERMAVLGADQNLKEQLRKLANEQIPGIRRNNPVELGEDVQRVLFLKDKIEAHFKSMNPIVRLRSLWTSHFLPTRLSFIEAKKLLKDNDEFIRAWTIQLYMERLGKIRSTMIEHDIFLQDLHHLAKNDQSAVVRLYVASALQRIPATNRWRILEALYTRSEDANDHNIPLMLWYAAEPMVALDFNRALAMAETTALPNLLNFTIRRTAALGTPDAFAAITKSLAHVNNDKSRLSILNGLSQSLKGQRSAKMPEGWKDVEAKFGESSNAEIRAQVQSLSLTFGSPGALVSLRKTVQNKSADANARRTALESLLGSKDSNLAPVLQNLLSDADLRGTVLRGLASYEDSQTPGKILAGYNSFNAEEKRDALNTLAARTSFAQPLLAAVAEGKLASKDLSADLIRQLRSLKNTEIDQQIEKVWGAFRDTSADKKPQIEKYRKIYRAGGSQPGDASRGRLVFSKTCQQCHTLFDVGGKVGPDLTGSNRADLDYILQNIIDPNAVIPIDYRASTLETKDDRVITGIVKKQDDKSVTILTPTETLTIPKGEMASLKQNELSMMPEGLIDALTDQEFRDLIYYLKQPGQVPLAAGGK